MKGRGEYMRTNCVEGSRYHLAAVNVESFLWTVWVRLYPDLLLCVHD